MSVNPIISRIANGRRLGARITVIGALAAIPAQVWRRQVVPDQPVTQTTTGLTWESVQMSELDDYNYNYELVGRAMVLFDATVAGNVFENGSLIDTGDAAAIAQIEPYDEQYTSQRDRALNEPDLQLKIGDVIALLFHEDFLLWYEIVTTTGQSLVADVGQKYVLNKRDDILKEPMSTEFDNRPEP